MRVGITQPACDHGQPRPTPAKPGRRLSGTNPLARYVGQETGARPPPQQRARPTTHDHQPAGEPGEPTTPDPNPRTKPLTLGPIGWSQRRVLTIGGWGLGRRSLRPVRA
jgi:hypothetical protein